MITALEPYRSDKALIQMLTDPVKKEEYTIRDKYDREIIYQMSLKSAESYLMIVWKMLHGLPLNTMTDYTDLEMLNYFYQNSKLWFRRDPAPIASDLFIGRFLSEVCLHLIRNLDKIVVDYVIYATKDIKVRNKIDMLDQSIQCFSQLARNMICGRPYKEETDKLFEMATICADGGMKRRTRLIRVYHEQMAALRDITKNGLLGSDFMVDDFIIINNIMLLAYMMVTESKLDPVKIDPEIAFSDDEAIKRVISKLGKRILDYKDMIAMTGNISGNIGVVSRLYEIFITCKPEVTYRFDDLQRDECLREGCRALAYLGFLSQSKIVHKILKKMIF